MQKVVTVNPLEKEEIEDINKLLESGWVPMFQFVFRAGESPSIYYHLVKRAEDMEIEVDMDMDEDEEDEDEFGFIEGEDDEDEENNWRV